MNLREFIIWHRWKIRALAPLGLQGPSLSVKSWLRLNDVLKGKRTMERIILKSSFYFAYLPLDRHCSPFKSR